MLRSITGKLTLGVGIFLAFITLVAVQAVSGISLTRQAVSHLSQIVLPHAVLSEEFDLELMRAVGEISSALLRHSSADLSHAGQHITNASEALDAMAQIDSREVEPLLRAMLVQRRELLSQVDMLWREVTPRVSDPALPSFALQLTTLEQIEADLDGLIQQRHRASAQLIDQGVSQTVAPVFTAGIAAPLSFGLIGLLAVLSVWLLHRQVVTPVRALAEVATKVGEGELDQRIDTAGIDEIGNLQRALLQMTANLRDRERALAEHTAQLIEHQRLELGLIQERDIAEAASKAKSAFLSVMSHELRTPLTTIIGYSQLMEQMLAAGHYQTLAADLGHVQEAGHHLLDLINDVLDLSRIEAGRASYIAEQVDVASLVNDATSAILPLVRQNNNRLEISCPEHVGTICSDPLKVRQVLLNLLGNAAKFTQAGTIRLSVAREQYDGADWLSFEVADTGIGIAADQLPKLFQPFSQVDGSLSRKYGGTGLGLALSRRLCQMLGGDISVASDFGKGSVFTVLLPALAPAPPGEHTPGG